MQSIKLITFGQFEKEYIEYVGEFITKEYTYPVSYEDGYLELGDYYNAARRQYDGNKILKTIDHLYSTNKSKTIGLFRVDLFIPILTFIFGQAFLHGNVGIASLFRLKNEIYGMPPDEELLWDRFLKEIIHELGHTFGLKHCQVPTCVMRSSNYVEDIDQKGAGLCQNCRNEIFPE